MCGGLLSSLATVSLANLFPFSDGHSGSNKPSASAVLWPSSLSSLLIFFHYGELVVCPRKTKTVVGKWAGVVVAGNKWEDASQMDCALHPVGSIWVSLFQKAQHAEQCGRVTWKDLLVIMKCQHANKPWVELWGGMKLFVDLELWLLNEGFGTLQLNFSQSRWNYGYLSGSPLPIKNSSWSKKR